jgi:hypothetical protein
LGKILQHVAGHFPENNFQVEINRNKNIETSKMALSLYNSYAGFLKAIISKNTIVLILLIGSII